MSNVTNIILTTRFEDRYNAETLNHMVSFRGDIGLVSADDERIEPRWYGGDSMLGMNVCIGACGELDLTKLVLAMREIEWHDPDCVQLLVCAHDDARFVEVDWQRTTERPSEDRLEM